MEKTVRGQEREGGFFALKIPEVKDVIVGELAERGEWVVANIDTTDVWPVKSQKMLFRGATIWILPVMDGRFPALAMRVEPPHSREGCELLLSRFLSLLAWVEGRGYLINGFSGGSLPNPMGRERKLGLSICDEFDLPYWPDQQTDSASLALALMREGRGLNHPGYSFLSFFRVIEAAFPEAKRRCEWMGGRLETITDHLAKQVIIELKSKGVTDLGDHLYKSGRSAMAHAREGVIIDPDDPADSRRMRAELPLIRNLAELAIEDSFHIETTQTNWTKHLYELAGFKKILGDDTIKMVRQSVDMSGNGPVDMPNIAISVRNHQTYVPLSNLAPLDLGQDGTSLYVKFGSENGFVQVTFKLDFAQERLVFDIFSDVFTGDRGTAGDAESVAEMHRFFKDYFGNGQLYIANAVTGDIISRKDAFIPKNMFLNPDGCDEIISKWKSLAMERRADESAQ